MGVKWIASLLGFIFGGGIFGGLIGFGVGSLIDSLVKNEYKGTSKQEGDFNISLLLLFSEVMKADGQVMKSELSFVKKWLVDNMGEEGALNRLQLLKEFLSKDIDLNEVCQKIQYSITYSSRLQLLHFLYGIALADGNCSKEEKEKIELIATLIGLSIGDYQTITAMYYKDKGYAYTILQVDERASDEEIKKAYKHLCIKYHPDKVASLGEKAQEAAKEKFQEINSAYEEIKKERNFN